MHAQTYRRKPKIIGVKRLKKQTKIKRLAAPAGVDERKRYLSDKTIKRLGSMQTGPHRADPDNEADRALARMVADRGMVGTIRRKNEK